MKRTTFFFFAGMLMGLLVLTMFAQTPAPVPVPTGLPSTPIDIYAALGFAVALFGGVGVKGITEMLKRLLKVDGTAAVICSAVVSIGAVAGYYITTHQSLNVGYALVYAILIFLNANGLYKANKPAPPA